RLAPAAHAGHRTTAQGRFTVRKGRRRQPRILKQRTDVQAVNGKQEILPEIAADQEDLADLVVDVCDAADLKRADDQPRLRHRRLMRSVNVAERVRIAPANRPGRKVETADPTWLACTPPAADVQKEL